MEKRTIVIIGSVLCLLFLSWYGLQRYRERLAYEELQKAIIREIVLKKIEEEAAEEAAEELARREAEIWANYKVEMEELEKQQWLEAGRKRFREDTPEAREEARQREEDDREMKRIIQEGKEAARRSRTYSRETYLDTMDIPDQVEQ